MQRQTFISILLPCLNQCLDRQFVVAFTAAIEAESAANDEVVFDDSPVFMITVRAGADSGHFEVTRPWASAGRSSSTPNLWRAVMVSLRPPTNCFYCRISLEAPPRDQKI
jgi:hypothetical protein